MLAWQLMKLEFENIETSEVYKNLSFSTITALDKELLQRAARYLKNRYVTYDVFNMQQ